MFPSIDFDTCKETLTEKKCLNVFENYLNKCGWPFIGTEFSSSKKLFNILTDLYRSVFEVKGNLVKKNAYAMVSVISYLLELQFGNCNKIRAVKCSDFLNAVIYFNPTNCVMSIETRIDEHKYDVSEFYKLEGNPLAQVQYLIENFDTVFLEVKDYDSDEFSFMYGE